RRHVEFGVAGDADFGVGQRDVLELLLERLRIIAADDVLAGQLEPAIALDRGPKARLEVGAEQALARPAGQQIDRLLIAARLRPDAHRDAGVTAADAEVAVLHDDGQRVAGAVPALAVATEPAD